MNKFFKNNSATILTIVSSVGIGITAIMSARDTIKAMDRIEIATRNNKTEGQNVTSFNIPLTTKQKIKIAAPCYIPTVITGLTTILCVCGANKLNKNVQKSLTSAYILLDQSYKEYRNSVKELYGDETNRAVVKHIANKKAEELQLTNPDGDTVFFDFYSLQFFNSTLSAIKEAEDAANEMLKMHGYISLGTLYSFLGADMRENDDLLGWSLDDGKNHGYDSIKIELEEIPLEDGSKGYALIFVNEPTAVLWS